MTQSKTRGQANVLRISAQVNILARKRLIAPSDAISRKEMYMGVLLSVLVKNPLCSLYVLFFVTSRGRFFRSAQIKYLPREQSKGMQIIEPDQSWKSMTLPSSSVTTRSILRARSWLWVAMTAANPVERTRSSKTLKTRSEVAGSRLPVGSSARRS
jgi:hypothetical protein